MDTPTLTVTYDLEGADLRSLARRLVWRDPLLRTALAVVPLLLLGVPVLLALLSGRPGGARWDVLLRELAINAGMALAACLVLAWFRTRQSEVIVRSTGALGRHQVTVAPSGLGILGPRGESRYAWADVAAVDALPDAVLFTLRGGQAAPVPRRAFASGEGETFLAAVRRYRGAPAPVPTEEAPPLPGKGPTFRVEFDLTPRDLAAFRKHYHSRLPRWRLPMMVLGTVLALLALVGRPLVEGGPAALGWSAGLLLLAALGIGGWVLLQRSRQDRVLSRCVFQLSRQGLQDASVGAPAACTYWSAVREVHETPDYLLIYLTETAGLVLPRRGFATPAEAEQASQAARKWVAEARRDGNREKRGRGRRS